jgi:hypothetical protein
MVFISQGRQDYQDIFLPFRKKGRKSHPPLAGGELVLLKPGLF